MSLPPYFPEPIEIPNNVAAQPFQKINCFIRKVSTCHYISLLSITAISFLPISLGCNQICFFIILMGLTALSIVRTLVTEPLQTKLSLIIFLPLCLFFGLCIKIIALNNWPIWAIIISATWSLFYCLTYERDFSFIGQLIIAFLASLVSFLVLLYLKIINLDLFVKAIIISFIYLNYIGYDLASLLSRRKQNEVLAAVIDLYRDILNIFGYSLRVIRHWRAYKL